MKVPLHIIAFAVLTTFAVTVLASEIVLPIRTISTQVQVDTYQMQEPFSSEPLQYYSSLEAVSYES
ncbi:MAG: hypothetical protein P8X88_08715 [Gammaproteobacteria bacterium]